MEWRGAHTQVLKPVAARRTAWRRNTGRQADAAVREFLANAPATRRT
jgi:hypothetical protein